MTWDRFALVNTSGIKMIILDSFALACQHFCAGVCTDVFFPRASENPPYIVALPVFISISRQGVNSFLWPGVDLFSDGLVH
jgi:hypothetical protein